MLHASTRRAGRSMLGVATLLGSLSAQRNASAETIDTTIGQGIGTFVPDAFGDGSNVVIDTSIESVRYDDPVHVSRDGLSFLEVSGSIKGTGWGGIWQELGQNPPAPIFEIESHYEYDVPFVMRFRTNFDGTLVYYTHGFGTLDDSVFFEQALGPLNDSRRCELEGTFISDAAVAATRRHGFFAPNLCGLGHEGQFTAFAIEGPFAGEPVVPNVDVPIARDLARVAQRLLEKLSGRAVAHTFGSGHSGGALVTQFIASGVTTELTTGFVDFTGGNFVSAYDPSSGTIFDGFFSWGGGGLNVFVHPEFPLTARSILFGGVADYAAVDYVIYAGRLLQNGVDLDSGVRVYQIPNMPHTFPELPESAPNIMRFVEEEFGFHIGVETDRMAPVAAAALDNLQNWVVSDIPPPPSRIEGTPVDTDGNGSLDAIVFPQAGGATTSLFPHVDDPSLDITFAEQFELSAAGGFPGSVTRYRLVLANHQHVGTGLVLPYQTCRLGAWELANTGTLIPFSDLENHWKNFGKYNSCLLGAVNALGHTGLYDKSIGKQVVVTDFIRDVFGH